MSKYVVSGTREMAEGERLDERNVGYRLLAMMGWKEGQVRVINNTLYYLLVTLIVIGFVSGMLLFELYIFYAMLIPLFIYL